MLQQNNAADGASPHDSLLNSGSPFGVVWGFAYGWQNETKGKAEIFMPQVRELGCRSIRLFLFWGLIEPEPGQFAWESVDTFLSQLQPSDEAWIVLGTSSPWATRRSTDVLPCSPARDLKAYSHFVQELVQHCQGRVRYWQMDNEPNEPVFWAGTAQEYADQLAVFSDAVRTADPNALVVLAGAQGTFDPSDPFQEAAARAGYQFFDYLLQHGADSFDVFDLHLYGDVYTVPACIQFYCQKMAALGYQKPLFIGEYNGPAPFEFGENFPFIGHLMGEFIASILDEDLQAQTEHSEAESRAIQTLYDRMDQLPPQTQMFLDGCSHELEEKRHRMNCRDLVMRNLLALSAGARKTFCWSLAPDPVERTRLMHFLFHKLNLLAYEEGVLGKPTPAAETLSLLAHKLTNIEVVRRIELPEHPALYLFEVQRQEQSSLFVLWERRDAFSGEEKPPTRFAWPWSAPHAQAIDALGKTVPTEVIHGYLSLDVSLTPIILEPSEAIHG